MSFKVYDVTQTELEYCGYKVKINGTEIKPDTARVSDVPFNRRWPGHQRSIEQTELINFVSLETDESITFEVTLPQKSDNVVIRPLSLGIKYKFINENTITFTIHNASYFTVEPYGRKNALHIFADFPASYGISKNDPDVIYFDKGEHDAGIIYLESNQTLFIDEGAVVYACVRADNAHNIKILGRGILDNSKNKEIIKYEKNAKNNTTAVANAVREHTVKFTYCSGITIEGITIRDSLVYNIRLWACKNIDISNVKIIGSWRYNSDGIDMHNCENVNIENCFIRTFDDCICVKGFDFFYVNDENKAYREAVYKHGNVYGKFKNIRVKNCVLWNDWGRCLEIGAETRAEEISNVVFESCKIIHVTMNVLDCQNADFAHIHNVIYRDIDVEYDDVIPECIYQLSDDMSYESMDRDYCPNLISVSVVNHHEYSSKGEKRGKNDNIKFENIRLYGRQTPVIEVLSYSEEYASTDVVIKNLYLNDRLVDKSQCLIESDKYSRFHFIQDNQ